MSEAWIETSTGLKFDILDPQPEMIEIADIAHALSLLCRFTGHTKYFYSVGQHSLHCSFLVPEEDMLWALMHDASEAYIGDMNRPLKHFSKAGEYYQEVEVKVQNAICQKFGLSLEEPKSVRIADNQMLYAEKAAVMPGDPAIWTKDWDDGNRTPADITIRKTAPEFVEKFFLSRFEQLQKLRLGRAA